MNYYVLSFEFLKACALLTKGQNEPLILVKATPHLARVARLQQIISANALNLQRSFEEFWLAQATILKHLRELKMQVYTQYN